MLVLWPATATPLDKTKQEHFYSVALRLPGGQMTAAIERMEPPRADVGWIVGATINLLRLRGLDLLLVALPFVWLPALLTALAPPDQSAVFQTAAAFLSVVFFGGGSRIAYQEIVGAGRVTAWGAIKVGLKRYVTLLLINLISTIMALAAGVLLVVPGIFVLVSFMTATTIAVAEDKGSTAALERAWMLSRGSRGRLAGLLGIALVSYLILLLVAAVIGFVAQLFAGGANLLTPVGRYVLAPIITTLLFMVTTVGAAAAYANLRSVKEGPIGVADAFA